MVPERKSIEYAHDAHSIHTYVNLANLFLAALRSDSLDISAKIQIGIQNPPVMIAKIKCKR